MATDGASSSPFPPGYLEEYNGHGLIAVSILFIVLEVVCVGLRFWARRIGKVAWGWDDNLMILSLITCLALIGCTLATISHGGVGYHEAAMAALSPSKLIVTAKLGLVIPIIYLPAVVLPKLAILVMYLRVFVKHLDRSLCWIMAALMVANWIGCMVAGFFSCTPLQFFWDRTIPGGYCFNITALYQWSGLMNIITDAIMLILPLPTVWKVHASKKSKIGLTITFATGSIGLITAIIRFEGFSGFDLSKDSTWTMTKRLTLVIIESATYLIAACLPSYRPLAVLLWRKTPISSLPLHSPTLPLQQVAGKHERTKVSLESLQDNGLDQSSEPGPGKTFFLLESTDK